MKVAVIVVVVALALALCAGSATAIEHEAGIRFLVAEPTGDFGDAVDDLGFGGALHYGVRVAPSFTLGFGLHAMIYGHESTDLDLPLVDEFELVTSNNLAGGFLMARWRPLHGAVQPYAEGRLGLNYLWTESRLEDDDWWSDDQIARETNLDDFAAFWSAGGGLLIRLAGGDRDAGRPGVYLDLEATYLRGGEAEYLAEGAIVIEDDEPVFAVDESATDLVTYELGVVLTF